VLWPGGVPPVITTGAGAITKVELDTYNGATWYGTAHLNYS
jgi:hypothetical protein